MADPTPEDVEAAEAAARRYCGWHVTPVLEDAELTLDGTGTQLLILPTLKVVELVSVTENGTSVDIDDLSVSTDGRVRKTSGGFWAWQYSSIEVVLTHGFAEAPDFDKGVSLLANAFANRRLDPMLTRKKIGEVEYQWSDRMVESIAGSYLLDQYKLEKQP